MGVAGASEEFVFCLEIGLGFLFFLGVGICVGTIRESCFWVGSWNKLIDFGTEIAGGVSSEDKHLQINSLLIRPAYCVYTQI